MPVVPQPAPIKKQDEALTVGRVHDDVSERISNKAADQKMYGNKPVTMTGRMVKVEWHVSGEWMLILSDADDKSKRVLCFVTEFQKNELSKLRAGDPVKVRGIVLAHFMPTDSHGLVVQVNDATLVLD
jgi:hypothetical protein